MRSPRPPRRSLARVSADSLRVEQGVMRAATGSRVSRRRPGHPAVKLASEGSHATGLGNRAQLGTSLVAELFLRRAYDLERQEWFLDQFEK